MLRRSWLCCLVLAACATLALAAPVFAQQCITGPEVSCEPAELCAPEGYAAYYWAPPGGGVQTTRCITATVEGFYTVRFGPSAAELGEPCFFKFHIECGPKCEITGKLEICRGEKTELCAPEGGTYVWSGPDGFSATTRCITVGTGHYTLLFTVNEIKSECSVDVVEKKEGCTFNCPRTPGFWGQQCRPDENGSVKFNTSQMDAITACVDDKAAIFSWGSNDFSNFCSTVNPAVSNQRTNAKKHFATFLANLCTDEQNLIANNGDEILLDPSTSVTCNGTTTTIGALVASIDAKLVQLEGMSLLLSSVKSQYGAIITCLNSINNGIGIGPVCAEKLTFTSGAALEGREESSLEHGLLEMARPFPNPTSGSMRMQYAVQGSDAMVKIAVYDISGRKIRDLVSGVHAAGVYQTEWNAHDARGSRVRSGIYFVRGSVGGQVSTRQVIVN